MKNIFFRSLIEKCLFQIFLLSILLVCFLSVSLAQAAQFNKVVVLGNSITQSAPNSLIGWHGSWGMAASRQENDFSHLVVSNLSKSQYRKEVELLALNVSDFERDPLNFNFSKLKVIDKYQPEIVIVFLGDNVPQSKYGEMSFKPNFAKLLSYLLKSPNVQLYCLTTWWANEKIDTIVQSACKSAGGDVVDISELSSTPGMRADAFGQFANAGVAAHPSDSGMKAIATKILFEIRLNNESH